MKGKILKYGPLTNRCRSLLLMVNATHVVYKCLTNFTQITYYLHLLDFVYSVTLLRYFKGSLGILCYQNVFHCFFQTQAINLSPLSATSVFASPQSRQSSTTLNTVLEPPQTPNSAPTSSPTCDSAFHGSFPTPTPHRNPYGTGPAATTHRTITGPRDCTPDAGPAPTRTSSGTSPLTTTTWTGPDFTWTGPAFTGTGPWCGMEGGRVAWRRAARRICWGWILVGWVSLLLVGSWHWRRPRTAGTGTRGIRCRGMGIMPGLKPDRICRSIRGCRRIIRTGLRRK